MFFIASQHMHCDFESDCNDFLDIHNEMFTDYWKSVKGENNVVSLKP